MRSKFRADLPSGHSLRMKVNEVLRMLQNDGWALVAT